MRKALRVHEGRRQAKRPWHIYYVYIKARKPIIIKKVCEVHVDSYFANKLNSVLRDRHRHRQTADQSKDPDPDPGPDPGPDPDPDTRTDTRARTHTHAHAHAQTQTQTQTQTHTHTPPCEQL